MEALLKGLLGGKKLGPAKEKVLGEILGRSESGVHKTNPEIFAADKQIIKGFIDGLREGTNATGVKAERIKTLMAVGDHLTVAAGPAAALPAPAAPAVAEPWVEKVSRTSGKTYWYNPSTGKSVWENPTAQPAAPPAAPPAAQAQAQAQAQAAQPVKTKKTRTDGDCFFSSIFRAANEQALLPLLATCNPLLQTCSESAFILSFRAILAQEIRAERLPMNAGGSINTYDSLRQLGVDGDQEDDAVYKGTIESFPDWFRAEFPTLESLGTQKQFVKRLACYVAQSYNDVGMIEVGIAQRLLSACPLHLDVLVDTPAALAASRNGVPVITLQNQGEGHYEYFSFNVPVPRGKAKAKGGSGMHRTRRLRLHLRSRSRSRSRLRRS